ncbi:MAG TPA: 3-methyl-2-oxobutanoate hydroxymethyltransferase [Deltaproteobacteria bacterium]|nr:3-methyl-2-oxobutanoate hydroxymethyltransferase [Deltaproteobacteria bacterium]
MDKVRVPHLALMKERGEKIAVLTAYGFAVARLLDEAGVPVILVGDSAGMVEAGWDTTLPVTLDEMVYHTRSVSRAARRALVVADMPFMSYQVSIEQARRSAGRLVKEGGAEAVKIEGGGNAALAIRAVADTDIPVMGHVGLTPQSIHRMGGFRVQGVEEAAAERVLDDARAVEEAGAFAVVVEGVPRELGRRITAALSIPTIGIGAGPDCDGQVLVVNDMLGLHPPGLRPPRFVKRYAELGAAVVDAARRYMEEVADGSFPSDEHCYRAAKAAGPE